MRTLRRATLSAAALLLLLPATAAAHAEFAASLPAADDVVTMLPPAIVLTFTDVLTAGSSFEVVGADGATAASGEPDPADPMTMSAPTPDLADGTYEVLWTAASGDGHLERGTFKFSVARPTPAPATAGTSVAPVVATPSPDISSPSTEVPATPAPTAVPGDGAGSAGDVVIPIAVVGLLVVGGLAFFLRRRGSA